MHLSSLLLLHFSAATNFVRLDVTKRYKKKKKQIRNSVSVFFFCFVAVFIIIFAFFSPARGVLDGYCIKCRLHRRCYPVGGHRPCTCHSNCPRIHTVASGKCAPHLAITHSTHSCCNRVIRSRVNTGPSDQPTKRPAKKQNVRRIECGLFLFLVRTLSQPIRPHITLLCWVINARCLLLLARSDQITSFYPFHYVQL